MVNNHAFHYLTLPFIKGAENLKISVQDKNIDPSLTLTERISRLAIGILEMIPIINYLVVAVDKYVIFKDRVSQLPSQPLEETPLLPHEKVPISSTEETPPTIPNPFTPIPNPPVTPSKNQFEDLPFFGLEDTEIKEEVFFKEPPKPAQKEILEIDDVTIDIDQTEDEEEILEIDSSSNEKTEKPSLFSKILSTAWTIGKIAGIILLAGGATYQLASAGGLISQEPGLTIRTNNFAITPSPLFISPEIQRTEWDNVFTNIQDTFEDHIPHIFTAPEVLTSEQRDTLKDMSIAIEEGHPRKFLESYKTLRSDFPSDSKIAKNALRLAAKAAAKGNDRELAYLTRRAYKTFRDPDQATSIDSYFLGGRQQDFHNPKVCLFTSYTTTGSPDRIEMSKKVAANQAGYSSKKGYSYLEYPENLAIDIDPVTGTEIRLEPYWSKIAAINKILNSQESSLSDEPEWIVWLDDDAVITNPNIRMEDVIHSYSPEGSGINFFVTSDSMSHVIPGIPLNSAVLFIKNNDWSRNFFGKVWEMRNKKIPNQPYTYGNCPNQSCLHEQQAITDLLTGDTSYARHARIIPQRDPDFDIGINAFVRENHIDLNRNNMKLWYNSDHPATQGRAGDFIQQCTGLATRAYQMDANGRPVEEKILNLRLKCIDTLLGVKPLHTH